MLSNSHAVKSIMFCVAVPIGGIARCKILMRRGQKADNSPTAAQYTRGKRRQARPVPGMTAVMQQSVPQWLTFIGCWRGTRRAVPSSRTQRSKQVLVHVDQTCR